MEISKLVSGLNDRDNVISTKEFLIKEKELQIEGMTSEHKLELEAMMVKMDEMKRSLDDSNLELLDSKQLLE